ncbi:MAG: hypothetical protein M1818_000141 [Claussenomyces sp. TS43310]|nr:MAG: hypothetical protein M1818_000141 [Claussenomyces sp. TS43310]
MAKGSRASATKSNNAKLKVRVFGPVENARTERLSAKLRELAAQPRWPQEEGGDVGVHNENEATKATHMTPAKEEKHADDMEIDKSVSLSMEKYKMGRGRIEKRKGSRSKAGIVFPKFKAGKKTGGLRVKR